MSEVFWIWVVLAVGALSLVGFLVLAVENAALRSLLNRYHETNETLADKLSEKDGWDRAEEERKWRAKHEEPIRNWSPQQKETP